MTRKKVKLAWVENAKSRAISLQKMRVGLLKKVKELTILCDVRALAIIFSPNKAEPMVWPSVEATHDLLGEFFALPKLVQKKKESSVESYLKEKTQKIHEQLMKSNKKKKDYVIDELMMQLQNNRRIVDLNLSEIYALLSFSRHIILLCRKKLDFMQFLPLRDPPVFPFEIQVKEFKTITNDIFVGQDNERAGRTDEATKRINVDIFKASKYGFNSFPNDDFPWFGWASLSPLQHHNMITNPMMAMNQPMQYPFDFMSHELEINEEENNINNSQFYRSNNTTMTNDGLRQEIAPNETTAGENNDDAMTFNTNMVWLGFNNHHF